MTLRLRKDYFQVLPRGPSFLNFNMNVLECLNNAFNERLMPWPRQQMLLVVVYVISKGVELI